MKKKAGRPPQPGYTKVKITLPDALFAEVRKRAKEEERTLSHTFGRLIRQGLQGPAEASWKHGDPGQD